MKDFRCTVTEERDIKGVKRMNTICQKLMQICFKSNNKKWKENCACVIKAVKNRSGSSLVGVVILSIVMSFTATGLLIVASNGMQDEAIFYDNDRAFLAAESGLYMGAAWLKDDDVRASFDPLADGAIIEDVLPDMMVNGFDVQVDITRTENGALVSSTAISNGKIGFNKVISQEVAFGVIPFDTLAFDHAMFSDNWLEAKAAGTVADDTGARGSIHSNSTIDFALKKNETINANVSSTVSVTIDGKSGSEVLGHVRAPTITGKTYISGSWSEETVDIIPFPDIDLTPWYDEALANGQVYDDARDVPNPCNPPGGIVWVKGDANIDITINGTLILEGVTGKEIIFSGNATAPNGGFAVACVNGNLKNHGDVDGLVYVKNGNFHMNSNTPIVGQILVKGSLYCNGTADFTFKKCIPAAPGGGDWDSNADFIPGSWKEINVTI